MNETERKEFQRMMAQSLRDNRDAIGKRDETVVTSTNRAETVVSMPFVRKATKSVA